MRGDRCEGSLFPSFGRSNWEEIHCFLNIYFLILHVFQYNLCFYETYTKWKILCHIFYRTEMTHHLWNKTIYYVPKWFTSCIKTIHYLHHTKNDTHFVPKLYIIYFKIKMAHMLYQIVYKQGNNQEQIWLINLKVVRCPTWTYIFYIFF